MRFLVRGFACRRRADAGAGSTSPRIASFFALRFWRQSAAGRRCARLTLLPCRDVVREASERPPLSNPGGGTGARGLVAGTCQGPARIRSHGARAVSCFIVRWRTIKQLPCAVNLTGTSASGSAGPPGRYHRDDSELGTPRKIGMLLDLGRDDNPLASRQRGNCHHALDRYAFESTESESVVIFRRQAVRAPAACRFFRRRVSLGRRSAARRASRLPRDRTSDSQAATAPGRPNLSR